MPVDPPLLVLIGGSPGSGKTTLASRLATELAIPLIARDALKEAMMDCLGSRNRAESRAIGAASFQLLPIAANHLIAAGVPALIDCNFSAGRAEAEWSPFAPRTRMVQLFCRTSPEVARRRFSDRVALGERHPGHHDDSPETIAEFEAGLRDGRSRPLDLAIPTLVIDTTDSYTPDIAVIRAFLMSQNRPPRSIASSSVGTDRASRMVSGDQPPLLKE